MATHRYHAALTYKIFCARKSESDKPTATFAQCREIIRRLGEATAGWRPGTCMARHGSTSRRRWNVGAVFGAVEWVTVTALRSSAAADPRRFKVQEGWLGLPLGTPFLVEASGKGSGTFVGQLIDEGLQRHA